MADLILNSLNNEQVQDILEKALNGALNGKKSVVIVSDDLLEQPEPTAEIYQERLNPDFILRNTLRECERQRDELMQLLTKEQQLTHKLRKINRSLVKKIESLRHSLEELEHRWNSEHDEHYQREKGDDDA